MHQCKYVHFQYLSHIRWYSLAFWYKMFFFWVPVPSAIDQITTDRFDPLRPLLSPSFFVLLRFGTKIKRYFFPSAIHMRSIFRLVLKTKFCKKRILKIQIPRHGWKLSFWSYDPRTQIYSSVDLINKIDSHISRARKFIVSRMLKTNHHHSAIISLTHTIVICWMHGWSIHIVNKLSLFICEENAGGRFSVI